MGLRCAVSMQLLIDFNKLAAALALMPAVWYGLQACCVVWLAVESCGQLKLLDRLA
jgi:hypothetical protein